MSRAAVTARATGCDVSTAKLLVVGSGGIGCELIKNLVLMGFTNIVMIDLDTIDYSNLNRQFLFRQKHVGQPKCFAARDAALAIPHDPGLTITARQANIKSEEFDLNFWRGFDLVLSALDNVDARKHVNQECLIANVPLVESGTQGSQGQVHAIFRGKTSCYSCHLPPPPQTYPVCTIRNHPETPVHCIHWVKELLFPELFGGHRTDLIDTESEADGREARAGQADPTNDEASPAAAPAPLMQEPGEAAFDFSCRVFRAVFEDDISRKARMHETWKEKERSPPVPLLLRPSGIGFEVTGASASKPHFPKPTAPTALPEATALRGAADSPEAAAWTVAESTAVFLATATKILEQRADEVGSLSFDKDDSDAMDFLTAASNLRMACFGIGMLSRWDAKGTAGRIIPAIASTNAIISGFIVLEALKILSGKREECRFCWCSEAMRGKRRDLRLMGTSLEPPNPECAVCGIPSLMLTVDTSTFTVGSLKTMLTEELGITKPTIVVTSRHPLATKPGHELKLSDGCIDPEDVDEDDAEDYVRYSSYLHKALASLPWPCNDGTELIIEDEGQDEGEAEGGGQGGDEEGDEAEKPWYMRPCYLKVYIRHAMLEGDEAPAGFRITNSNLEEVKAKRAAARAAAKQLAVKEAAAVAEVEAEEEEVQEVAKAASSSAPPLAGVKRTSSEDRASTKRRGEVVEGDGDDVVCLSD